MDAHAKSQITSDLVPDQNEGDPRGSIDIEIPTTDETDDRATDPGARRDRPGSHPELLHHRPHRPRQVDAGRPDAAAHRGGRRAPDARAVPGPDGHRARAR